MILVPTLCVGMHPDAPASPRRRAPKSRSHAERGSEKGKKNQKRRGQLTDHGTLSHPSNQPTNKLTNPTQLPTHLLLNLGPTVPQGDGAVEDQMVRGGVHGVRGVVALALELDRDTGFGVGQNWLQLGVGEDL